MNRNQIQYQYDLHIHSNYSDSDDSPKELVEIAKINKMKGIVLTDHNTILGLDNFLKFAKKEHIRTLEGVEISTKFHETDIHILGYSNKFNRKKLRDGLKNTVNGYNQRSQEMVKKVIKNGIADINFEEILHKKPSKKCSLTRYDIAREITEKTNIPLSEASKFVARSGVAYVPYGDWAMNPFDAVQLIIKSKGIPVLAHPGEFFDNKRSLNSNNRAEDLIELIVKLKRIGLLGLECRYSKHTNTQEKQFINLANKHKLIITGGTDYHGLVHKPNIEMGTHGVREYEFQKLILSIKKGRTENVRPV